MKKQLLLFHNAICAYFSGNQTGLEDAISSFHIRVKASEDSRPPSFLEGQQRQQEQQQQPKSTDKTAEQS